MIIDFTPKDKTGRWFAWRPVWVGHKLAWLEHVERYYGHKGERVFWTYMLPSPAQRERVSDPLTSTGGDAP